MRSTLLCGAVAMLLLWRAAAAPANEPVIDPQDMARAVESAIAGLSATSPPAVVEESSRFLASHGAEAAVLLAAAQKQAQGMQLLRIISVRGELDKQRHEYKKSLPNPLREFLSAEPTLRFLLALAWIVGVLVAAKVFRSHLAPTLHGYIGSHHIHVDPGTLLGIERLIGGLIILVGLNVGISLFVIQGFPLATQPYYDAFRSKLFNAGFFIAFGYGLLKVIDIGFDSAGKRFQEAGTVDARLVLIFRNIAKGILAVGTVLLALENFTVGVQSLLLATGLVGLAFALASRDVLTNLFGAISVLAGRPYVVGDRIQVEGLDGYVESIGLQATRLRTQEGTLATVPNRLAAASVVNNLSRRPHTRKTFLVRLKPSCPRERVERSLAILRETLQGNRGLQDYWAHLAQIASDAIEIQVSLWCRQTDPRLALEEIEEIHLEIKRRFDAEGITEHLQGGS